MHPDISIVIPLLNEEESLPLLHEWIVRVMQENRYSYEIIFIDDGSRDGSWKVIEGIAKKDQHVKGIKFRRNYGKSAALNTGFADASGKVVFTMDADLQDSPDELPAMYRMITEEGYDLVSGWKRKRYDPITKTIPTKLYNWATRQMSGIKLHDFNCGLKAYKNEVVKNIEVYGEMHRYIPVIAKWEGYHKIGEKAVKHQERKFGTTKFGISRFIRGPLDLMSISFVSSFGKRPMHFFGGLGMLVFFIGFVLAVYIGMEKLYFITAHVRAPLITDRPWFYLSLVAMIIGVQLFLTGFLAEMVARNAPDRNVYEVSKKIGLTD